MNSARILITACAAAAFLFTSCGDERGGSGTSIPGEKETLAAFKTAADELNTLSEADAGSTGLMAGIAKMNTVMAKMNAIKTDGLPADLREAFVNFRRKREEMTGLLGEMPENLEDRAVWARKMGPDLGDKMGSLGQEAGALGQKCSEVARKYGIETNLGW